MTWEKKIELKLVSLYLLAGLAFMLAGVALTFSVIAYVRTGGSADKKMIESTVVLNELTPGKNGYVPLGNSQHSIELVWIPSGSMKTKMDDSDAIIQLPGFWMGQYEVTQAQYIEVMGDNPVKNRSEGKDYGIGDDYPVYFVSREDAEKFCKKLNELERSQGRLPLEYEYTLPTESQWEYACRAGTTGDYKNDAELSDLAWFFDNSGGKTHPVGQKKPNAWGLYDMHGNVWEWSKKKDLATYRYRGGGWGSDSDSCRSGYCGIEKSDFKKQYHGFRVSLSKITKEISNSIEKESESYNKNKTIQLSDTVSLDMIWIDPGTFIMGSPIDEPDRYDREAQHQVELTKGFWLGKYEVTQAQYEAVMGTNPSDFKGADLPVEQVSWNDAVKFCEWLTAQERAAGRLPEGYEYTLPTEAQWEYACRAGTTTAFNNGTNIPTMLQRTDRPCPNLDPLAWYGYNSGQYDSAGNYTGNGKTFPVGQKQPNAWGLYDMHGNVWEWCLDWYGSYPSSAVTDPKGPATGSNRVMRGGSWNDYARGCRSANRYYFTPGNRYDFIGFRVALAPIQ